MSNVDLPATGAGRRSSGAAARPDRAHRARAASAADLRVPVPATLAMRPTAAKSVANVNRVGVADAAPEDRGASFHDRLSARLNEIINDIDHEVFRGGELVLGMSRPRLWRRC
jgi:hypothetical protein